MTRRRGTMFLVVFLAARGASADEPVRDDGSGDASGEGRDAGGERGAASGEGDERTAEPTTRTVEVVDAAPDRDAGAPRTADAVRALEEPAFVTVIRPDERRGEARSVAEVLAESVGVRVRSLGGLGAFASISLRGAPGSQTEILIDGVPMSRLSFATFDLGGLDLSTFDRVDVYRGGVPAELGGAVLGGAVSLVTRVGPRPDGTKTELSLGGGSFGARSARAARHDAFANGLLLTTVQAAYAGADGDFSFFDDRGTPLEPQDDGESVRRNNGFDRFDLVLRARLRRGFVFDLGNRTSLHVQGIPGPRGAQAERATLTTFRNLADVSQSLNLPGFRRLRLSLRGHSLVESVRWEDPDGEVGLASQDKRYVTTAGGATVAAAFVATRHQLLRFALDGRLEGVAETNLLAADNDDAGSSGRRAGFSISASDEIVYGEADELVIIPAARLDWLATRGDGLTSPAVGGEAPEERTDVHLSPRVGVRWRLTSAFSVKANLGRYFRPPSLPELFGDRGFLVGNPGLLPETGVAGDVGFVFAPPVAEGAFDRLYLEAAFFAARSRDLIALQMTSGRTARAANLGDARIAGYELALAARAWRAATITANYTFLDTSQRSPLVSYAGKRLPGRPRHEAYVRLDVRRAIGRWELGAWADANLVSSSFLDAGNTDEVPARRLFGLGVRVAPRPGLAISLEARNLFDERVEEIALGREVRPGVDSIPRPVSDFLGYPLPGRAIHAALESTF